MTTWKWLEADRNLTFANQETKRANDQTGIAKHAESAAKEETARANKMSKRTGDALEAFKFAFGSVNPYISGKSDMSAREVLDRATDYLSLIHI